MKTVKILTILVMALGLMVCSAKVCEAGPMGTAFTYQGRLIDANDAADGLYDFKFKLYDANSDGSQAGSDVNKPDVDVIDGYFTVELDFGSGLFDGNAVWLEIGVRPGELEDTNGYTVLSPRQEVTPTPYALYAQTAGSDNDWMVSGNDMYSIPSGNVGIGTMNPSATLDVNGTVTATADDYTISGSATASDGWGVYGEATGSIGVGVTGVGGGGEGIGAYGAAFGSDGIGVYAYGDGTYGFGASCSSPGTYGWGIYSSGGEYAGYFDGDVIITGDLTVEGTKGFVQPHPTDASKQIVYVCLEGGENGVYVRGSSQLDNGRVRIQLPEHFRLVAGEEGITVQLTPRDTKAKGYLCAEEVSSDQIVVVEAGGGTSNGRFDYLVMGVRRGFEKYEAIQENTHVKADSKSKISRAEYEQWRVALHKNRGIQQLLVEKRARLHAKRRK